VIPSIDLRDGKVVRLYQGDYDRQRVFSDDPMGVALEWQRQGAPRLHVVDLDGALLGAPGNLEVLRELAGRVAVPLQAGGGIRTLDTAHEVLGMGVQRIVLGTAAVEDPDLVRELLRLFGQEAIVVGVDARDGMVAIRGWKESTTASATELIRWMTALGVGRFVVTDIARDGTLTEPNFHSLAQVVQSTPAAVVASGGIASLDHLKRLAALGVEGAIIGSALYTGTLDFRQAVRAMEA